MEPSEEIRRVVGRWLAATAEGDVDSLLGRMSDDDGALSIGTDPDEWWHGRETFAVWRRQLEEAGPFPFRLVEIEAWEEGTVGWAAARVSIDPPEHVRDARLSCVLHLERGEWKVVQHHLSLPQSNAAAYGATLTVSLEQLEQSIRREQPNLSASLAVDGTVTIVFTDIVDSTLTLSRLSATSPGSRSLAATTPSSKKVTAAHGGTVVETQGDGSMLAFSSARRAVACAQAIQHGIERAFDSSPPIRVRIGIHTGDALQEAEHFFGTTVHYAARVASQALGGEVLVSSLVRELVAGGTSNVSFLEGREVELKGLEGQHRLYALAPCSGSTSATVVDLLTPEPKD